MAEDADIIAEAIAKTADSVDQDGAMCTGWVLVAQWVGADGGHWMTRLADSETPRWQTLGLLRTAQVHYEHEMLGLAE